MKATAQKWRNRILGLEQHKPSDLLDHPHQWRVHPANQVNALRGVLDEVGIAGALVAYRSKRADGALVKIDGHARAGLGNAEWPVLVLDVDDAEADLLLATYDPLGAMALADKEQLDGLLREVEFGDAAVQGMLGKLAADVGIVEFDHAAEWQGMPEFEQRDLTAFRSIHVHFKCREDAEAFAELVGQDIGEKIRSIWYPEVEKIKMDAEAWQDES